MRETLKRTRGTALALLLVGAGALAFPTSSPPPEPDGRASLVLQVGFPGAAAPTSMWGAAESGESSSPAPQRRDGRDAGLPGLRAGALVRGPSDPELRVIRSGGALLGLPAAPANAPPHV